MYGRLGNGAVWVGLQCKLKVDDAGLSRAEIEREVRKARTFKPHLSRFLIATTAPRDIAAQEAARAITAAQLQEGSFSVTVVAWEDIVLDLASFPDLIAKHYQALAATLIPQSRLSGVTATPKLPPHFLPRPEAFGAIKTKLLARVPSCIGITAAGLGTVGVQGMGGIGKSVLAATVAADEEVQSAFHDGVFWVTVGHRPDLLRILTELAVAAGEIRPFLDSPHQGKFLLSRLFAEREALLVLDDIWQLDTAKALDVVGPRGRLLITTRDAEILVGLGAEEHRVDVLSPEQALILLASWAGLEVRDLPSFAAEIARECGYLPLALAMVGAMVRLRPIGWADALERLKHAALGKIRRNFPDYPYPDLLRALEVSVEALSPHDRDRYLELAVFPEDAAIPVAVLETLWSSVGLSSADARDLVGKFVARSLAQVDTENRVRLHDLQADYLRHEVSDLCRLHSCLVDAYATRYLKELAQGPDDGYFFQQIPFHLLGAGRIIELRDLLLNYIWLERKLAATSINSLLADYTALPDDAELHIVQRALRLAAHVLAAHPEELAGQLLGRLLGRAEPDIAALLGGVRRGQPGPWLRPLAACLSAPDGSLERTFTGHLGAVSTAAVLPYGRIISGGQDRTLRLWDLETGKTLRTLEGHSAGLTAVAFLPEGRAISASYDGTLQVWDIESGTKLVTLRGHSGPVLALAVLSNNRVVSASSDCSLRLWDIKSGDALKMLNGHAEGVLALAALPNGHIVSASYDGTLRVWDLDTGKTLRVIRGHSAVKRALTVLHDGRIVSASTDRTLQVWDATSGTVLRTLEGHSGGVNAVAVAQNGSIISASADRTLRVWDASSGKSIKTLEGHSGAVNAVVVTPDGRVISASADRTLRIWSVEDDKDTAKHPGRHSGAVLAVTVLNDGRVITASNDGRLGVWDFGSGRMIRSLEGHSDWVRGLAALPNGVVVSASSDRALRVWDIDSGTTLRELKGHSARVRAMVVVSDVRVVSASSDRTLRVWDVDSGRTLKILRGHSARVRAIAALPNGRIVSAADDRTLRVWDLESGEVLHIHGSLAARVRAVATIGDSRVVFASDDLALRILDVDSGQIINTFRGISGRIHAVITIPGGRIISASEDRTLRVWDVISGQVIARFTLDTPPTALALHADLGGVVVGDQSGSLHFFRLE